MACRKKSLELETMMFGFCLGFSHCLVIIELIGKRSTFLGLASLSKNKGSGLGDSNPLPTLLIVKTL